MSAEQCYLEALSSSFQPKEASPGEYNARKSPTTHFKFQEFNSLAHSKNDLSNKILFFKFEGTLLKTPSLFPYFMLVAFEAGGLFRSLVLLLMSPFVCLVGGELGIKMMVFLCFFGVRKEKLRVGTAVLPKFYLGDVGFDGLDVVMRCGKKVGISDLPRVMVEGFLRDYVGVDAIVARELKVVGGYFLGLMDETKTNSLDIVNQIFGEEKKSDPQAIGLVSCQTKSLHQQLLSHCKEEVYLVTEDERQSWRSLPRDKYPKPLIFHDGRLAFKPTQLATLGMFMYLPLAICISIIRILSGILLPLSVSAPVLAFTGTITTISPSLPYKTCSTNYQQNPKGRLYVCNHKTLLDPLYVGVASGKPQITAVTYSLSSFNEKISPIRTISLKRDREKDAETMKKFLRQGDLVVCPEGTTCREPYLLRFSPLFAELTDEIVPVAIDVQVNMFYGTTASGFKMLDPIFHFMNPNPVYTIKILGKLTGPETCKVGGKSRFEVANNVQNVIGKVLGFECTSLTRKDKYMALAGNDGILKDSR